jgi:hypothetical protein
MMEVWSDEKTQADQFGRCKRIGDALYIDWEQVDLDQFHQGLIGNHKGETMDLDTGLIYDGVIRTGKVPWLICRNSRITSPAWKS